MNHNSNTSQKNAQRFENITERTSENVNIRSGLAKGQALRIFSMEQYVPMINWKGYAQKCIISVEGEKGEVGS